MLQAIATLVPSEYLSNYERSSFLPPRCIRMCRIQAFLTTPLLSLRDMYVGIGRLYKAYYDRQLIGLSLSA
jgi:hypothetical protein